MEKLKRIEKKLLSQDTFQIDIMDVLSESIVERAINKKKLDEEHNGSLKSYLNNLNQKGFVKIQLIPRRRFGSSSKPAGAIVTVDFQKQKKMDQNFGFGLNGVSGLGMPEIMDGLAARRENQFLKSQLEELKRDLRDEKEAKSRWRDKAESLQRSNDIFEVRQNTEKEPSALDKLIEGLAANPSAIPALIGAFKGSGLNSPAAAIAAPSAYSEIQNALIEMIVQLPDEICNDLATLISRIFENDKNFITDLRKLIETPNLKKVENG